MKAWFEKEMVGNLVVVGHRKSCICVKSPSTVTEDIKPPTFSFLQRVQCKRLEISSWLWSSLRNKEPNEKVNWHTLGKLTVINCTKWKAIPLLAITIKPPYDKTQITVKCMEQGPTTVIGHFEVVTLGQCSVRLQSGTLQWRYHIGYYKIAKKLG